MTTHHVTVNASCTECGWSGPRVRVPISRRLRWTRYVVIWLAQFTYWWHLLFGRRHTHWEWSR